MLLKPQYTDRDKAARKALSLSRKYMKKRAPNNIRFFYNVVRCDPATGDPVSEYDHQIRPLIVYVWRLQRTSV